MEIGILYINYIFNGNRFIWLWRIRSPTTCKPENQEHEDQGQEDHYWLSLFFPVLSRLRYFTLPRDTAFLSRLTSSCGWPVSVIPSPVPLEDLVRKRVQALSRIRPSSPATAFPDVKPTPMGGWCPEKTSPLGETTGHILGWMTPSSDGTTLLTFYLYKTPNFGVNEWNGQLSLLCQNKILLRG